MTRAKEILLKEMRYIASISNGQVKRVAEDALASVSAYLATEPSGERADSAQWLREFADMEFSYYSREATQLRKAADMLEADVSLINEGNKAQQAKRVPMTVEDIFRTSKKFKSIFALVPCTEVAHFARDIEAHHGITPADKPIVDESEDLYALALKADNWGQP